MSTDVTKPGAELLRERLRSARRSSPAIPVAGRDAPLPLSFGQRGLWVLDRMRPGGADYLVPIVLRLRGELSEPGLRRALSELVGRHEILRTRYGTDCVGEPVQVIDPPAPVSLDDELGGPVDLAEGPVLRARLARTAPDEHELSIEVHHIAIDGWSIGLLVKELAALYAGEKLPAPALQYADFAAWQREQRWESGLAYWRGRLEGLPALELPTDRSRPAVWQPDGVTVPFRIPAEICRRVSALAGARGATPYMVYLSAFWSLLYRYTGQADFAVGSPIAGRTAAETHDMQGLFANMLVLRADLSGEPAFTELIERARTTAIDAYAHQDVPFDRVVDALGVGRDLAAHPLFSVSFALQTNEQVKFEAGAVSGELVPVLADQAKFDLSMTLEQRGDGSIGGEITIPTALFDERTAQRLSEHYVRLLGGAVVEPDTRVADLPLLSTHELDRLTRGPAAPLLTGSCLHESFAAQARLRPGAVAVTDADRKVTYAELDAEANRLAHRLRELGVRRGDLVGIRLGRGAALVVALLATLKAGAAYLPLDPGLPASRLAFLIGDAGATVVITESAYVAEGPPQIVLDDPREPARLASLPADAPAVATHPDDLAYVIYTSGSTGRPKGVQVTHANVARLFTATEQDYRFGKHDVWALFHSFAFDFSVWEIWGALLFGGRLVVVGYDVSRSPWELADLLAAEGVTVLNQTPSAFRSLVELAGRGEEVLDRLRLRLVIFGGEAVDVDSLGPWWSRYGDAVPQLVNMYGITETTVHVTYRPLGRADLGGERSPIGRAIHDLAVYVLDGRMRPVPVGVPGELYVGGPGVARGYLGRPSLTAERFVPDPFGAPGGRLYRTGDKARVLANGDIGFLGRFDDQVKIRGFRIELGEVRACLAAHPGVEAAAVVVDEQQLVAYVVPRKGGRQGDLRAFVAERLPGYMVPAVFMSVPELPLTTSGKIDRAALPAPERSGRGQSGARTPEEEAMAQIWADVLGAARVGVHDNFFELGGDSIRAVRLVGRLRSAGFDYSVQDLFRRQSIAELRGAVSAGSGDEVGTPPFALIGAEDLARVPEGVVDAYPMASVQEGMAHELLADPDTRPYHNVTSYLIRDGAAFDAAALSAAIDALVAGHEILRTSFDLASFSRPMQLVHRQATAEFGHADLRAVPAAEQEERMEAFRARERERVFDLGSAPLIRVHAHQVADDRWFLSLTEFHAILDGWSHNSVVSELLAGYRTIRDGGQAARHAASQVRYADFVAQELRSLAGETDRTFWAGRLAGATPLRIPEAWSDQEGPAGYSLLVPYRDLEAELRSLAGLAGASLKSVLLAAHLAVWRAVAGGWGFSSGLVCNGRTEAEGGDQVRGMFLNPVPFVAPEGTATWRELVRAVFEEEVELWPHRRFPLPELQRSFGDGGRLLEVAFNYLDFHVLDREMVDTSGSIDVSPNEFPLAVSTQGGNLLIMAQSRWIGREHAEVLGEMYRRALTLMAADPEGPVRESLLPPAERARLLTAGESTPAPRQDRGVHGLVGEQVARRPEAVAVEHAGAVFTYGQLADRAGAWAAALRAAGVRRGDLVGVGLQRGVDWVACVVGVLQVGAAYVPFDPLHPVERTTAILREAGISVAAAGKAQDGWPVTVLTPGHLDAAHHPRPEEDADGEWGVKEVGERSPEEELVYVVHTSGSSGRPKGVMVRHGALADRVLSMRATMALTERDVVVAVVPAVTDVAQLATFAALATGARLVLADDDFARDPTSLAALLRDCGATLMQASPTTWRMLAESGWSPGKGFRLLSGGERMDAELVTRLCATEAEVWNNYGPSEATVFCFGSRLAADAPPAWTPAANTTAYVLDDDLEPVLDGVAGQIFVGGYGLARGYLGMPGRTAESFLPDPHSALPGSRMYATGDVGRRDPGGGIDVLGRRDEQVKIRGFRVELGEIENVLSGYDGVRAAVAKAVAGPQGEAQLAAYVILHEHGTLDGLRDHLTRAVPVHLVPTHFVVMQDFPRLPNGKVDRAALPVPAAQRPRLATPYDQPRGETEETIAGVWADVLGIERVGRDDDFFALGGHSLLTLRIVARLDKEHGIGLSFRQFLTHRTVAGVAGVATRGGEGRERPPALLWLGDQGERTPLFCVHPGGGSARWYLDLADTLAPERPLAAFEWPGLHGDFGPAQSVAEIARSYLVELRAARPAGPYHLLGWCGSSGIAWEMARRLRAAGEQVRLILLDPVVDTSVRDNAALLANVAVFRRAEGLFEQLREGTSAPHAELLSVLRGVVDDGDIVFEEADLGEVWAHRLRAWRELLEVRLTYRFPAYEGTVDLILCEELAGDKYAAVLTQSFASYLHEWRRLATGGLRVHHVPGDHRGTLRPPNVSTLADTLAGIIDTSKE